MTNEIMNKIETIRKTMVHDEFNAGVVGDRFINDLIQGLMVSIYTGEYPRKAYYNFYYLYFAKAFSRIKIEDYKVGDPIVTVKVNTFLKMNVKTFMELRELGIIERVMDEAEEDAFSDRSY